MIPTWLTVANKYVGTKEVHGPKDNPLILKMFERIRFGKTHDETPWCAAFVGNCLEEVGILSTRSAGALSYRTYGTALPAPVLGSIAVKKRLNSAGKVIGGHVFFVVGVRPDGLLLGLGGNQGDAVSVAPFNPRVIVAHRWPPGVPMRAASPLPLITGTGSNLNIRED